MARALLCIPHNLFGAAAHHTINTAGITNNGVHYQCEHHVWLGDHAFHSTARIPKTPASTLMAPSFHRCIISADNFPIQREIVAPIYRQIRTTHMIGNKYAVGLCSSAVFALAATVLLGISLQSTEAVSADVVTNTDAAASVPTGMANTTGQYGYGYGQQGHDRQGYGQHGYGKHDKQSYGGEYSPHEACIIKSYTGYVNQRSEILDRFGYGYGSANVPLVRDTS